MPRLIGVFRKGLIYIKHLEQYLTQWHKVSPQIILAILISPIMDRPLIMLASPISSCKGNFLPYNFWRNNYRSPILCKDSVCPRHTWLDKVCKPKPQINLWSITLPVKEQWPYKEETSFLENVRKMRKISIRNMRKKIIKLRNYIDNTEKE